MMPCSKCGGVFHAADECGAQIQPLPFKEPDPALLALIEQIECDADSIVGMPSQMLAGRESKVFES